MSNIIQAVNQEQTMSSRQIAELTGKEHKHVLRDCLNMFCELEINHNGYAQNWTHPQNKQTYIEYLLTRDLVDTLVTGYSIKLRHAVMKKWRELEERKEPLDLNNPLQLRSLLLDYAEKNIQLTEQVQILEPKAKGLDRIANCNSNLGIRESAKVLKINQKTLVQYLMDHKVVYRDQSKKIQGYQKSVDQKLIHITVSGPRETESGEKVFSQVKLTQKLITRIATWIENGMPEKKPKKILIDTGKLRDRIVYDFD